MGVRRGRLSQDRPDEAGRRGWGTTAAIVVALAVVASMLSPLTSASAANSDVVISEMMFNPPSGVDGDEFLELTNIGAAAVDVSGWCFSGITLCFAPSTSIAAGGRLVVGKDAARFQLEYGFAANAIYTGSLSNGGETITLKDSTAAVVDAVAYSDRDPWPTTTDGTGPSLELIDPTQDNNDPVNWAASTALSGSTPGAANSVAAAGLRPHVSAVLATPTVPTVSQPVTVTATVTGQTSVVVRYQVDFTGEQAVAMTSLGGDAYTATLPGAAAGHLIRYRVEATNAAGTSYSPRLDDSSPFKGVVVASGVTSAVPMVEWFMNDPDYTLITQNPLIDITRAGVLAYNGTVYDGTMFSIRGEGTQDNPKVSWKVVLPQDHTLQIAGLVEPVDEFAMNADWSDSSHGRTTLAWDSYQTAGVVNEQIMQLRVQKNSTFFGLYTYTDIFEGTWRSREGYSNKQFYKGGHAGFDATKQLVEYRFEKKNPDDEDFTTLAAFLNGVDLTGAAQKNNLLATANLPEMINYAVATAIVEHTDSSTKNFYLSQDPTTGRWSVIPWDLDHTFGHKCCGVNSNFATPAEPGDQASELMAAILAVPEWKQMYFRRLRTVLNSVLATGRLEAVYDAKVGPAAPESALDFAKWPHTGGSLNFASQRTLLFKAIQARRNVFAADSRVPANQSPAPSIVIDEIQPSLVNGAGGQFVELYNPSATEAVDLSGWALSGSVNLQIQPGTVILPGGRMTFVANDPAFEDTYGGLVFVGGVFGGGLGASGTIALTRADASTADSVAYGGADWPAVTDTRSLELVDPASDNSLGTSWALSTASAGSPGAANQTAVVGSLPGAPTIGAVSAGGAAATVSWTAPSSNGGSPITGYQVRVLDVNNVQVGAARPASPTVTSIAVTGLTVGTPYSFQVAAVNAVGVGAPSAVSGTVTPVQILASSRPIITGVTQGAAGGTITATVRWSPPASTGSGPVNGYEIYALLMSSSASNATVLGQSVSPVAAASARQKAFTLTAGYYQFVVVALNPAGFSPPSARSASVLAR